MDLDVAPNSSSYLWAHQPVTDPGTQGIVYTYSKPDMTGPRTFLSDAWLVEGR